MGRAIERGRRNDDEIGPADILAASRNAAASYLIVTAFVILPEHRNSRECPVRRIVRFTLCHILDTYLATDRTMKVLSIGFSEHGEKASRTFGLEPNGCHANYGAAGGHKPVMVAELDRSRLQALLRRL